MNYLTCFALLLGGCQIYETVDGPIDYKQQVGLSDRSSTLHLEPDGTLTFTATYATTKMTTLDADQRDELFTLASNAHLSAVDGDYPDNNCDDGCGYYHVTVQIAERSYTATFGEGSVLPTGLGMFHKVLLDLDATQTGPEL